MEKLPAGWVCTDPDNHQYGRKIGKGEYEFKELDHRQERNDPEETHPTEDIFIESVFDNPDYWVVLNVVLNLYNNEELESYASGYYGSLSKLKEDCGLDWEWVLAECIFEQTSGLY